MPVYEVTIHCTLTERVEAPSEREAEFIAREEARIGDCAIVWASVIEADEEEAA
jgi:hypothetical protein